MSKQYNQLNLEIRFDAAELAILRKLVRQASLAAFEQKHFQPSRRIDLDSQAPARRSLPINPNTAG
jgi:hypothetical protein